MTNTVAVTRSKAAEMAVTTPEDLGDKAPGDLNFCRPPSA